MILSKGDTKVMDNCKLPGDVLYRARVISTKFDKQNSKGNPMTTLGCEIIAPEVINGDDGKEHNIAGRPFNIYLTHMLSPVGNQQESGQSQVFRLMEKLGVNDLMEVADDGYPQYDTEKHREYFLGMEFDLNLNCEQNFKREKPNKEAGERVGKVMKDGEGNPITDGYRINVFASDILEMCNPERNETVANAAF